MEPSFLLPWTADIGALARCVAALCETRPDRLATLTIAAPARLLGPELVRTIEVHLTDFGLDFIDIRLVPGDYVELLRSEFEAW